MAYALLPSAIDQYKFSRLRLVTLIKKIQRQVVVSKRQDDTMRESNPQFLT